MNNAKVGLGTRRVRFFASNACTLWRYYLLFRPNYPYDQVVNVLLHRRSNPHLDYVQHAERKGQRAERR